MEKRSSLLMWYFFFASAMIISVYLYLTVEISLQNIFLGLMAFILLLFFVFIYRQYFHQEKKLRRKMQELNDDLTKESFDFLREKYMQVYHIYLKLSEKKKRNFYARINLIRENIENKVKVEKRMQSLLKSSAHAGWKDLEIIHKELQEKFMLLPKKMQDVYYHEVSNIKDMLEHRKK